MDGWKYGWIVGWMDGQMEGWVDERVRGRNVLFLPKDDNQSDCDPPGDGIMQFCFVLKKCGFYSQCNVKALKNGSREPSLTMACKVFD